jgi:hypothetical protein
MSQNGAMRNSLRWAKLTKGMRSELSACVDSTLSGLLTTYLPQALATPFTRAETLLWIIKGAGEREQLGMFVTTHQEQGTENRKLGDGDKSHKT